VRKDTTPEVMKPQQVADYLQFHIKTVYDLINTGKLKASKLGPRSWRILKKDVDLFFETQALRSAVPALYKNMDGFPETQTLEQEAAILNSNEATERAVQKGKGTTTKDVKSKEDKPKEVDAPVWSKLAEKGV